VPKGYCAAALAGAIFFSAGFFFACFGPLGEISLYDVGDSFASPLHATAVRGRQSGPTFHSAASPIALGLALFLVSLS
jgi:hypothetical protein